MYVKVEAEDVEVRIGRIDSLTGCPRQRGAIDQILVDATVYVSGEDGSRDGLGREPFELGEP